MKRVFAIAVCLLLFGSIVKGLDVYVDKVVLGWQTEAERQAYTGVQGELIYNVDTQDITVFDGSTLGGFVVGTGGGGGNTVGGTAPASVSDSGTLGDMRVEGNYFYICVGPNSWKRALLTTW